MAQTRFHQWENPVDSGRINEHFRSVHSGGRISGFDGFTPSPATLTGTITHTEEPGTRTTTAATPVALTGLGVWSSQQGAVIVEDASLAGLSFSSNAANAWVRYDAVYGEHVHAQITGGQAATYGVVTGTAANTIPALPDPDIQTLLGYLAIPANAITVDNAKWYPARPSFIGSSPALIDWANDFAGRLGMVPHDNRSGGVSSLVSGTLILTEGSSLVIYETPSASTVTIDEIFWGNSLVEPPLGTRLTFHVPPASPGNVELSSPLFINVGFTAGSNIIVKPGTYVDLIYSDNTLGFHQWFIIGSRVFERDRGYYNPKSNLSLLNSWAASGGFTPGYQRSNEGVVHLRGRVDGTSASNTLLGTLPTGFRPVTPFTLYVPSEAPGAGTGDYGILSIAANGNIYIDWSPTGQPNALFGLINISFPTV